MRSLRTRVLLAVSATTATVLILLGLGIYLAVRDALLGDFDRSSLVKARAIASLTEERSGIVVLDADDLQMPEFSQASRAKHREYYQLWYAGKVIARSPGLENRDLLPAVPHLPPEPRYEAFTLPGNVPGRMVQLAFSPAMDNEGTAATQKALAVVMVARPTHEMDEVLGDVASLCWMLGAAAVIIACATLWLLMHRAFRPLAAIARQIGQLAAGALGAEITAATAPSELDPVISKLNDLLKRLEEAFSRERAFSADVAHELRTPLAGMIMTLEVCRSRTRDPEAYQAAIDKSLAVAGRMNQLVENLLLLARESNQLRTVLKEERLDVLLESCFAEQHAVAASKNVEVTWRFQSPLPFATDAGQLRVILENLFENAVTYVNPGGKILVKASREKNITIEITNTGGAVPAADVHHLTERFWRVDTARTDTGVHCGLGLAIAKRMAEILNLKLAIQSQAGAEFRVTLTSISPNPPPTQIELLK